MSSKIGFGDLKQKLDLQDFKPKRSSTKPRNKGDEDQFREDQLVDEIAEKEGFKSREQTRRVIKKRKSKVVTDTAYIRAPIEVLNEFKLFCNDHDLTYGEGLEQLLASRTKQK
jgi:hypothetical protein